MDGGALFDIRLHLEAHLSGRGETGGVGGVLRQGALGGVGREHHEVHAEHEFSLGALGGVLQLERAAGSVAGVGKRLLADGLALAVHGLEGVEGIDHFAPGLEVVGPLALQTQGDGGDGAGVGGDVVAHSAVAAGDGLHQLSATVG